MVMKAMLVILLMGLAGLFLGLLIAYANRKFAVELNPLIHIIEDVLPKGQCGACGYAGCQAYAEAVTLDQKVPPDLCIPGKADVAKKIAQLTGKKMGTVEARIAFVGCANPIEIAAKKFEYSGIDDCIAASLLHLGPKDCRYGCIGFGTCVKHCPFGAIKLNEKGLPVINGSRCTGCGKCETVCPKKLIRLEPRHGLVGVACNSQEKGTEARRHCPIACLGCGLCVRECPYNAIKIENNLAIVDSAICIAQCETPVCLEKCPTGTIRRQVAPNRRVK
jgi:electron transport complex protein RnfB